MKNLFTYIILVIFCAIPAQNTFAATYSAKINIYSNENSLPRKAFNYYIDFKQEVNLASIKMNIVGKKDKKIPIYVIPLAKYKALIYFMPHEEMEEDSELYYTLSFENGKWDGKDTGDANLKKKIKRSPNLVPNPSFEKVEKSIESFMTWEGRTSIINWRLQDYTRQYISVDNIKSTCRTSSKEAFQGKRSICFSNIKSHMIRTNGREKKVLISGSARTSKLILLKPNTKYQLSFLVKITKQIDNDMNFQGVGISLTFLNYYKRTIPGGALSAVYSISSIMREEYFNKWVYVEAYDTTDENTHFGTLNITEKISGITYVDMVGLREVEDSVFPEIIVDKIIKVNAN